MHKLVCLILTSTILNVQGDKINIRGLKYYEYSYQEIINQGDFINNFVIYTKDYNYYFYPSIDYKKIGISSYILNVFNGTKYGGFNFDLNIIDDVAPIIYGVDKVFYSSKDKININNLLSLFYGEDEIDGRLNVYVYDYLETSKKNILTLRCEDQSNNYVDKNVEIIYQEKSNLLFIKEDLNLHLYKNKYYSANDLINLMIEYKLIENITDFNAKFKNNKPFIKYDEIGIENEEINLMYKGKEYKLYLNIFIEEQLNSDTFITKIINFIKGIIFKMKGFFYEE